MSVTKENNFTERETDRIISMAWEDRTTFEAIEYQFGLTEKEVIKFMKEQMHPRNWRKWRARVQGRKTKHEKLRDNDEVQRFKSDRQRQITGNRISKKKY
ncbi:TIGR03643 family protein [Christiangramia sp. SM2212]|uniref:TIGR03643 family protein n=1 Tax=Christiangramia sediminicola TaxID=3073267 RepID=A0ABU1ELC5_9FLAO|nr:TIGR03643 family protein [Christiangramia sp. SM2212]MDR5589181.1 TIGR03643 family protein [Christiangramia sp. SM2212]